jgi:hypothetical protein
VLLAMGAPLEWDELAYHLPYARDYANAGGLVVSENLRYPLQAHNYQLLYAAALLFAQEPATHLLHALAGGMTAAGMFAFARHHFGQAAALLAVILFLAFAGSLFDAAYADLGLAMFVFYAFYSFTLWQRSGADGYLLLAAFLLAMAAGTKYQALAQLPAFALALVVAARGAWPGAFLRAGVVLFLFGSGWYLRSWLISGDPVHPIGAEWFGYWLWDAQDLAGQYADFDRYRHHLPLELLPALGFLFLKERSDPVARSLAIVAFTGLLAWYLSSRYDRYLLPSYPFLALMSAQVLVAAGRRLGAGRLAGYLDEIRRGRAGIFLRASALVLAVGVLAQTVHGKWDELCFTRACVDRVHGARLASPAVARAVPGFAELRPYQLGLENELFVIGPHAAGDWFGPYRYREVLALVEDPAALRMHLLSLGRDSLLVNRQRAPFEAFSRQFGDPPGFIKLYEDPRVTLYRLAPD